METVADGGARVRWTPQKLTMEEYLFFVESDKLVDLTVEQLNQIIDFHGYKKLHKTPKRIISEAISTMALMKPSRSTLQDDDVSSSAVMSLDDVIKELNELGWQECCVTSLQMLNSVDLQSHQQHLESNASALTVKQKRPRKKLKKLMISNMYTIAATNGLESGDSRSASCSSAVRDGGCARPTKLVPKRKWSGKGKSKGKGKGKGRAGGSPSGDGGSGGSALVLFGSGGD